MYGNVVELDGVGGEETLFFSFKLSFFLKASKVMVVEMARMTRGKQAVMVSFLKMSMVDQERFLELEKQLQAVESSRQQAAETKEPAGV